MREFIPQTYVRSDLFFAFRNEDDVGGRTRVSRDEQ